MFNLTLKHAFINIFDMGIVHKQVNNHSLLFYATPHFYTILQITQRTVDINTEVEENSTAGNFCSVVLLVR